MILLSTYTGTHTQAHTEGERRFWCGAAEALTSHMLFPVQGKPSPILQNTARSSSCMSFPWGFVPSQTLPSPNQQSPCCALWPYRNTCPPLHGPHPAHWPVPVSVSPIRWWGTWGQALPSTLYPRLVACVWTVISAHKTFIKLNWILLSGTSERRVVLIKTFLYSILSLTKSFFIICLI